MNVSIETKINSTAEQVWQVLAHQFAEIDQWASVVQTSRPLSLSEVPENMTVSPQAPIPGRVTKTPLGELREVFIKFDEQQRTFTFESADRPFFAAGAKNTSSVTALNAETAKLAFEIQMEINGVFKLFQPLLRRRFMSTYGKVQKDLKNYLEKPNLNTV